MKKRGLLALALAGVMALAMVGCSSSSDSGEETAAASSELIGVYSTYDNIVIAESSGYEIPMSTDLTLYAFSDGTYILTEEQTMDISEPSGGYLSQVGYTRTSYGTYTYSDEDGESLYVLDLPSRVIFSDYMMTGPMDVTEIYVDSADADTYENYSPDDITELTEEEVVTILLNTSYAGTLTEGDAIYYENVVVNEETFMIEETY